mgnify:CR=1 FL=1
MKIFQNIYLAFLVLILSGILFVYSVYRYELSEVSSDDELKTVIIEPGSVDSIATTLYEENLIRNKLAFKAYVKFSGKSNLKAATYSLSEDMGTRKIVDILYEGDGINLEQIKITFKEGLNMRGIAKVISDNTNNSDDDVYNTLDNKEYLNGIIDKYWFVEEDILNNDIYYSLEGYLYPSTYYLGSRDVTVEEIFDVMLEETGKQLEAYKEQISNSDMSVHEILTLASIVELEGVTDEDRKGIAGVFFNRLQDDISLGSDVTTYYGVRVDMGERDLYSDEVSGCNDYNTRCVTFSGLPVSPICNSSLSSIEAVLNPDETNNYYFVADKNRKIYFSKNITEHNNTIAKLKKEDLWYTY